MEIARCSFGNGWALSPTQERRGHRPVGMPREAPLLTVRKQDTEASQADAVFSESTDGLPTES